MTEIEKLEDTSGPTWQAQWIVASHTSSEEYKVSQKFDGTWACSCAHWKFMKAPKHDCKHILQVKATERQTVTARDFLAERTRRRAAGRIVRRPVSVPAPEPVAPVVFVKQTIRKIYLER